VAFLLITLPCVLSEFLEFKYNGTTLCTQPIDMNGTMILTLQPCHKTEDGKAVEGSMQNFAVLTEAFDSSDLDIMWILLCGALVMFMQAGFGLLEAGAVRKKNVQNILFKNFADCCVATIWFWLLGYGFAYGGSDDGGFIGSDNFGLSLEPEESGYHSFFFQWAFSNAASTIVSGSVAERFNLSAYMVYASIITAFVYPVVVHWVWDGDGWASAFGDAGLFNVGMIDFAGSGVVHSVGGFAGLVGAALVGPRLGRFKGAGAVSMDEEMHDIDVAFESSSYANAGIGTFILWFGWYGFNCGSTLAIVGAGPIAGHVAVTTTMAAAAGGFSATLARYLAKGHWDLGACLNGVLAGLVSITAGCPVITPGLSLIVGAFGGLVYLASSKLLKAVKIDDPLDASPLHGFCGAWGVLAAALFANKELATAAGYNTSVDGWWGKQVSANLVGELAIIGWTVSVCSVTLGITRQIFFLWSPYGLRVPPNHEIKGLDHAHHGASAKKKPPVPDDQVLGFKGDIKVRTTYNAQYGTLKVFVLECRNLMSEKNSYCNPFVTIEYNGQKKATKISKNTANPDFDYEATFQNVDSDSAKLTLSVWSWSWKGADLKIGGVEIVASQGAVKNGKWFPIGGAKDIALEVVEEKSEQPSPEQEEKSEEKSEEKPEEKPEPEVNTTDPEQQPLRQPMSLDEEEPRNEEELISEQL